MNHYDKCSNALGMSVGAGAAREQDRNQINTAAAMPTAPVTFGAVLDEMRLVRDAADQIEALALTLRSLVLGVSAGAPEQPKSTPTPDGWLPYSLQAAQEINFTLRRAGAVLEQLHERFAQ